MGTIFKDTLICLKTIVEVIDQSKNKQKKELKPTHKFRVTNYKGHIRSLNEIQSLSGDFYGSLDNIKEGLENSFKRQLKGHLEKNKKYDIDLTLQLIKREKNVIKCDVLLKKYRKYPNKGVKMRIEIREKDNFSW